MKIIINNNGNNNNIKNIKQPLIIIEQELTWKTKIKKGRLKIISKLFLDFLIFLISLFPSIVKTKECNKRELDLSEFLLFL